MNEEKEIKYMTQDIEAGTMLEGLYIAGDMQAKNLTAKKNRKFNLTAKELTTPVAKGGVELNELDENIWTEYRIVTPVGRYTVANKSLWALIDRAEIAMKVSPAKRHRFTILPAEQEDSDVVARFSFDADTMLPKMKPCLEKEAIRPIMMVPAVEVKTGVMIATDGHILAVHRLKGYQAEEDYERMEHGMVSVPKEVLQMKGRITVVVAKATWTEGKVKYDGLLITATDENGKSGEVHQSGRFPNWRSVTPSSNLSLPIPVDAQAMAKAVKLLLPQLNPVFPHLSMTAVCGAKELELNGGEIDFSMSGDVKLPIDGGMPTGIWMAINAQWLLQALAFKPTRMHYIEPSRPVLFFSDDTMVLVMPALREGSMPEGNYGVNTTTGFNLSEWLGEKPEPQKTVKKPEKKKEAKVVVKQAAQPKDTTAQLSLADRLREALMARLAA